MAVKEGCVPADWQQEKAHWWELKSSTPDGSSREWTDLQGPRRRGFECESAATILFGVFAKFSGTVAQRASVASSKI